MLNEFNVYDTVDQRTGQTRCELACRRFFSCPLFNPPKDHQFSLEALGAKRRTSGEQLAVEIDIHHVAPSEFALFDALVLRLPPQHLQLQRLSFPNLQHFESTIPNRE